MVISEPVMAANPIKAQLYAKTSKSDVYINGGLNATIDLNTVQEFYPLEDMTLTGLFNMNLQFKGNLSDIENEEFENFYATGNLSVTDLETNQAGLPPISIYKTPKSDIQKAKFPVIDMHSHEYAKSEEEIDKVSMMNRDKKKLAKS